MKYSARLSIAFAAYNRRVPWFLPFFGNTNSTSEYVGSSSKLPITSRSCLGTERQATEGGGLGTAGDEDITHMMIKASAGELHFVGSRQYLAARIAPWINGEVS